LWSSGEKGFGEKMSGEKNSKKKKLFAVAFVWMTVAFYMRGIFFDLGGFNAGVYYILLVGFIIAAFFCFLVSPDVSAFLESLRLVSIPMLQVFVCLFVSMLIALFQFTGLREMISGFFRTAYHLIGMGVACALIYLLKEKAVSCLFWALVSVFGLNAAEQIHAVGAGEFFGQLYTLLASFANKTGPAMKVLEYLELEGSFAICLIYFYCFRSRDGKGRFLLRGAIAVLCMAMGLKRGSVLALLAAFAACFLYRLLPERYRRPFVRLLILALIAYSFLIIPLLGGGILEKFANSLGIDSKSRFELYRYYADYYEISPLYGGRGIGWVDDFVRNTGGVFGEYLSANPVHNEYIRSYIELGFWGYIGWILSFFPWVLNKMAKTEDRDGSAAVIGCVVFMAVGATFTNVYTDIPRYMVYTAVLMASCGNRTMEGGEKAHENIGCHHERDAHGRHHVGAVQLCKGAEEPPGI